MQYIIIFEILIHTDYSSYIMQFLFGMLFTILHDIIIISIAYNPGKLCFLHSVFSTKSLLYFLYLQFLLLFEQDGFYIPSPFEISNGAFLSGLDYCLFPTLHTLYKDVTAHLYSDFSQEGLI